MKPLKDNWSEEIEHTLDISRATLTMTVRFDGYGNSVVRFHVHKDGKETEFTSFDAAVQRYNWIR